LQAQAVRAYQAGRAAEAVRLAEQVLAMRRRLYPGSRYPQGHPALAVSLADLGFLWHSQGEYDKAVGYLEQALAMRRRLYPESRYPQGHVHLARSLSDLGAVLYSQREYGKALGYLEQALAMRRRLYPESRYPQGHPSLAQGLSNLGALLGSQGEFARARAYLEQALAMNRKLYPAARYPQGHPDLATSLTNLGVVLQSGGEDARAQACHEEALALYRRLYPESRFSDGHPDLATCLDHLGTVLQAQGKYGKALAYLEQALAMYRRLYPESRYRQGHPDLAACLNNLGFLLYARGEYSRARDSLARSVAMYRRLYPESRYPQGHPDLVSCLSSLGFVLHCQGEYARALACHEEALALYHAQHRRLAEGAAEAEALVLRRPLPLSRDLLLSLTRDRPADAARTYAHLWPGRSAVTRVLQRRHLAALAALGRPRVRRHWDELLSVRRQLTRLLLTPTRPPAFDRQVRELTERKERLERLLSRELPALPEEQALEALGSADLGKTLPKRTAFIDLLRYIRFEQDPMVPGKKGLRLTYGYAAFVLLPGRPVRRAELGAAEVIERALARWRQSIARRADSPAAGQLRRLVWEPLARHLDRDTRLVYLAPDGPLARLPWAALPGRKAGSVLLEEHALAVVPHGPFLLGRLRARPAPARAGATLLAVGAVAYDDAPARRRPLEVADLRPPERARTRGKWPALPGTAVELQRLRASSGAAVKVLRGKEASTARLAEELPKARLAHLATHGFFHADLLEAERKRQAEQLRSGLFRVGRATGLVGQGARNPLGYCGLVLAGANRPAEAGADGGILTGEAVLGLDLRALDLAVLSACRTGLGDEADGECVHHLQHAFHTAGCGNVVASLWDVPDRPTAALMALFYDRLLRHKETPLEALRQAQLFLYRHPKRIKELAERGAPRLELAVPAPKESAGGKRAAVKDWAGFILSGLGR
jgi:CHAT domain-containing protein/Tfp pilus assembly protein PilF